MSKFNLITDLKYVDKRLSIKVKSELSFKFKIAVARNGPKSLVYIKVRIKKNKKIFKKAICFNQ